MYVIRPDDLSASASRELIALHLSSMHADSPPGHVFALDRSGLTAPGVSMWSAWDGDAIVAIGALKRLDDRTGEVKSMRTHPDHVRRGAATLILDRIIDAARSIGLSRLSLETGSGPTFEPALALHRKRGFVNGEAFADYTSSSFNQFLHLAL